MPTVKISPPPRQQYLDSNGDPYIGGKLFTYAAGSSTKQATYTDNTGATANTNPIILDTSGRTPNGVWLATGQLYKYVLALATDTDPPTSPVFTADVIEGVNDTTTPAALAVSAQWVASTLTPTYVSGTQFTLTGDQTAAFHVGRRLRLMVTAGIVYGKITVSAFSALTTVTVLLDSGALDAGLSVVDFGILTVLNSSIPDAGGIVSRPSGALSATTVQGALNELDTDLTAGLATKAALSGSAAQDFATKIMAASGPAFSTAGDINLKSSATLSTSVTITAAQLVGGEVVSSPAAAISLTLPTPANILAATGFASAVAGSSFLFTIINTTGLAVTLVANGNTLVGNNVITNGSATWRVRMTGAGAVSVVRLDGAAAISLGTAVATTSGTAIDFTGIPAAVKRLSLMFSGVSSNGTSGLIVQLGSGAIATTGYLSSGFRSNGSAVANGNATTGLLVDLGIAATDLRNGIIHINLLTGNTWVSSSLIGLDTGQSGMATGRIVLAGALDRLRITTISGTDTFDAGSVNLSWEF